MLVDRTHLTNFFTTKRDQTREGTAGIAPGSPYEQRMSGAAAAYNDAALYISSLAAGNGSPHNGGQRNGTAPLPAITQSLPALVLNHRDAEYLLLAIRVFEQQAGRADTKYVPDPDRATDLTNHLCQKYGIPVAAWLDPQTA